MSDFSIYAERLYDRILEEISGASERITAVLERAHENAVEQGAPFVLLRPRMFRDGNQWCALYGDNLQDGVAGFGSTPAHAAEAFNCAWYEALNQAPRPADRTDNTTQQGGQS
jgi:hypothetical protein